MPIAHRLNYKTFVEEIPQHERSATERLVDKFHAQNTYLISLSGRKLVGMLAGAMLARLISEQEGRYRAANPIPAVPVPAPARREGIVVVGEAADETGTARAPS